MSSVLSLFGWGASAAKAADPAPAATQVAAVESAATPSVPPALPSLVRATSTEDEFVIVDQGDQSSSSSNSSVHSRQSSLDDSMIDVSKKEAANEAPLVSTSSSSAVSPPAAVEEDAPTIKSPTTRACRPYGHAHSPPAMLPVTVAPASAALPAAAQASPQASPSKRSFASVAAATSSSAPIKVVAYAQDAAIDLAEQLRMQIALIEAQIARDKATAPEDPLEYAAPLPKSQVRVPLNRDQAIRYTLKGQVDPLAVEEPSSKRAKRTAPTSVTLTKEAAAAKQAKSKAKPHKVARKEEKQMRRERGDKAEAAVDVSA